MPLPDDVEHAISVRGEDTDAMKAGLALDELAVVEVDDGPLALARLGRLVQERGSAKRSETGYIIFPLSRIAPVTHAPCTAQRPPRRSRLPGAHPQCPERKQPQ